MMSTEMYQFIKPLRAKALFKKVLFILVQLNSITINWWKKFGVRNAENYKDQISKIIIYYGREDVTCIWKWLDRSKYEVC